MPVPTTRTKETGEIVIHEELCNGCGLCVSVCKDFSLVMRNDKVTKSDTALFGCIGCGHCMAICPTGAIEVFGRELSPKDLFTLPRRDLMASYEQLLALLQRRRSVREFKEQEVDPLMIEKIVTAAQTAPMGLPPTDVHLLILDSKEKNRAFARDYSAYLKSIRWMASGIFLFMMRPFWGKANDEMFRGFIRPLFNVYIDDMAKGDNYITYDAPLAMYFYGSPYSDPADPLIAATYAMLAGESLGLGSCMLGGIHPFIQNGAKARRFREKYNIRHKSKEGLMVIFGHPAVKYSKGINRTFASIDTLN